MKLLDVKEIAQILNVKPSTVYQWAELGQMPCFKLNGCLRFDIDDITGWIQSCKKEAHSSYNSLTQARGPKERRK
ncbi:MAG: helix-turn-helix domain-containing protein [Nitrospirota bacterium]